MALVRRRPRSLCVAPSSSLFCIVVFSKSYCPYCKATKSLLSELGAKYEVLELDQIGMSASLTRELQSWC